MEISASRAKEREPHMTRSEFDAFVYETLVHDELERLKETLSLYEVIDEEDDESMYDYARENVRNNMKKILDLYELGREINR